MSGDRRTVRGLGSRVVEAWGPSGWPLIAVAALTLGCAGDATGPRGGVPTIDALTVESNPNNALSAVVQARIGGADSAAVRFRTLAAGANELTTPAVRLGPGVAGRNGAGGDVALLPVLGLEPVEVYSLSVVAWGRGGLATSASLAFTTEPLPADLPSFAAGGPDPSPGFVVLAAGAYGLVIDNTGRVVWYRRFDNGPGLNFVAQPNGRYYARPPPGDPSDPSAIAPWVELDPLGEVLREIRCALGLQARFHDLIAGPDGDSWLLCDETRVMDLTPWGGVADARVTGTNVQHVSATGQLLFGWSPFDHFAITDVDAAERAGPAVNWTHANALDFDTDGDLLVSFRNLNEITKIDVPTGAVIWRLGGLRNEFTFTATPMPAFVRQHGLRVHAPGSILLLDNAGDPSESRAERYEIDGATRTAQLSGSYGPAPGVITPFGGSVQDLPGGRTLASFGTQGRVEEYDADGRLVWSIAGNPGYVFRAQRIGSLYSPGVGSPR